MATLLLTAVGTAVGGPLGGAIGAFVGRQADSIIVGNGSREGPRLKELSVTTSSYGQPIPRNFGRMRVAGSVIWSTDLVETTTKEGGGKGRPSTKTYSYSASFAVALSSTPINRIGRIWADGNLLRGASGDLKVEGTMRAYLGNGDSPVDPAIAADKGGQVPAFRDCAYVVFENLQLADFGNRIPALTFEILGHQDSSVTLDQLVPQSVSDTADMALENALGFSDEGGPIVGALSAIDRVFPLNCVSGASGIKLSSTTVFPDPIPTLPQQLSDRDSEQADQFHASRGATLGYEPLAIRYYDHERDYQPGVQRATGLRPDGRENMVDLPVAMTATGAKRLANSNSIRARWRDEKAVWRIGELDPEIVPGSVVRLPNKNGIWRVRSWEWFDRGIELELERLAPKLEDSAESVAGNANLPIDAVITETDLWVFEAPPENSSSPNNPIILAAATSSSSGWRGAALYVDQAGTLAHIGSASPRRSVTGTLATGMGQSSGLLFEPNASFEIELSADDLSLPSTDMTGIAMGANRLMVGGEVLQFLLAEPIAGSRWKVSGLLRGRAGTEDAAMGGHAAGAFAVLIDEQPLDLSYAIDAPHPGTRVAAIGSADPEPVYATVLNPGISRRPPMPVAPSLSENSDGSWEFCWTRRARGQWRWSDGLDVPLVEEFERYAVGYGPSDEPFAAWTTTSPSFTLTMAKRTDLVSTFGASGLWVRQIGTFSQSAALHLAYIS